MKRLTTDKFVSIIDHNDLEVRKFKLIFRLEIMLEKVLQVMFIKQYINQMEWLLQLKYVESFIVLNVII